MSFFKNKFVYVGAFALLSVILFYPCFFCLSKQVKFYLDRPVFEVGAGILVCILSNYLTYGLKYVFPGLFTKLFEKSDEKLKMRRMSQKIVECLLNSRKKRMSNRKFAKVVRKYIIRNCELDDYKFNYVLEGVVEEYQWNKNNEILQNYKDLSIICCSQLKSFFDNRETNSPQGRTSINRDVAFVAFYLLSLVCKKIIKWCNENDGIVSEAMDTLRDLGENEKYTNVFSVSYPLYYEVKARWAKRNGKEKESLKCDELAMAALDKKEHENCALFASYVSSVCSCIEKGVMTEEKDRERIRRAYGLIDKCLLKHPEYPKYAFLYARLIYADAVRKRKCDMIGSVEYVRSLCKALDFSEYAISENNKKKTDHTAIGHASVKQNDIKFEQLKSVIKNGILNLHSLTIESTAAIRTGNRVLLLDSGEKICKPFEDFLVNDVKNGVYIVMDGITRPHEEYKNCKVSPAAEVAKVFAERIHENIINLMRIEKGERLLRYATRDAIRNIATKPISDSTWTEFPPGAVGIVVVICDGMMYYLSMGDCCGMIIRTDGLNLGHLYFGRQNSIGAVEKEKYSKQYRYKYVCNNSNHKLRYSIFNGEEDAIEIADIGEMKLERGDLVFLYSDGLERYFRYENPKEIMSFGTKMEDLLDTSVLFDKEPYAKYSDDKSVIRIQCK